MTTRVRLATYPRGGYYHQRARRERLARTLFGVWVVVCLLAACYGLWLVYARTAAPMPRPTLSGGVDGLSARRFSEIPSVEASSCLYEASRRRLVPEWREAFVSWYGPGLYGNRCADARTTLTPETVNVAHRTLPFGTRIEFEYHGRRVVAVVNDRGPFVDGRLFDLGPGTAKALGFSGVGVVRWRFAR